MNAGSDASRYAARLSAAAAWRLCAVARKAAGRLPGVRWRDTITDILPRRPSVSRPDVVSLVASSGGRDTFATPWGQFCLPHPGAEVLEWLLHEVFIEAAYENNCVKVEAGDVVIDCGAHVGTFARFAYNSRASRVFAFELDDLNFQCLQSNLSQYGQSFTAYNVALWKDVLRMCWRRGSCSDTHSLVYLPSEEGAPVAQIITTTLDHALMACTIDRIDFVKIDVEGAEPQVLEGALQLLRKFKPKLAIAIYHDPSEGRRIQQLFKANQLHYNVSYKKVSRGRPNVMFCNP